MKAPKPPKIRNWLLVVVLIVSIGLNLYLLYTQNDSGVKASYVVADPDQKIKDIEDYLDTISPSYTADEQLLAKQYNIPSWGCGPSSYAMAEILNKNFFNNQLVIDAAYNNRNPYEIIERFGLAQKDTQVIDHAWLEVYFKDKFLFIDPSIGQFGKIDKIAYQVFTVGQPDIQDILKKQYGIYDMRISILMKKTLDRVPVEQPPYPGMTILPNFINYYMVVLEDRNDVDDGIEPVEWKSWVSFLTSRYFNQG